MISQNEHNQIKVRWVFTFTLRNQKAYNRFVPKLICPICGDVYLKSKLNFWNEDVCAKCFRSGKRASDSEYVPRLANAFTSEESLSDYFEIGVTAARRAAKYSKLFDRIGNVLRIINNLGCVALLVISFFLDFSTAMRALFITLVFVVWGLGYIQMALIRGLASYFQMRASDFLIRHS